MFVALLEFIYSAQLIPFPPQLLSTCIIGNLITLRHIGGEDPAFQLLIPIKFYVWRVA